jgi:hypothetical protein
MILAITRQPVLEVLVLVYKEGKGEGAEKMDLMLGIPPSQIYDVHIYVGKA